MCENTLLKDEESTKGYSLIAKKNVLRWVIMIFVGTITGLFTCLCEILIDQGANVKFSFLKSQIDKCSGKWCLLIPLGYWILINTSLVFVASMLVSYVEVSKQLYLNQVFNALSIL